MSKTNLGKVSAYGLAVQYGYTGTVEEFGQMLVDASEGVAQLDEAVQRAIDEADRSYENAYSSRLYARDSEAWSVGTRGGASVDSTDDAYHNNAKYYAQQAIDNIEQWDEEVDVLKARMDTFTSLDEGSTTGDAELADIRIGADGTVYGSAGSAVREQVSNLRSEIEGLSDDLGILQNLNTGDKGNIVEAINWLLGKSGKCR